MQVTLGLGHISYRRFTRVLSRWILETLTPGLTVIRWIE